jgi:hypothetical protein
VPVGCLFADLCKSSLYSGCEPFVGHVCRKFLLLSGLPFPPLMVSCGAEVFTVKVVDPLSFWFMISAFLSCLRSLLPQEQEDILLYFVEHRLANFYIKDSSL